MSLSLSRPLKVRLGDPARVGEMATGEMAQVIFFPLQFRTPPHLCVRHCVHTLLSGCTFVRKLEANAGCLPQIILPLIFRVSH